MTSRYAVLLTAVRIPRLRRIGPGDWFGELALLRDIPRTATVKAQTDMVLHVRDTFLVSVTKAPRSVQVADGWAEDHYR